MGPRLCVLVAAVCFGTTGTAQALGPADARAVAVGSGRIVLGGALLTGLALLAGRRARADGGGPALPRAGVGVLLLAGACVAAYQLCFFAAVQKTGVAVGTIAAIGSGPAFAGALGWLVARDNPGVRWAVATVLAGAGVCLLVAGGSSASVSPVGVGLALGAGAGYASYTVISKQLLRAGHSPQSVMAGAFGAGGLLLLPALIVTAGPWLRTTGGLAMMVFLAVVPTALAYVLFARGLRELTAGETATLTLAEPLTAALLGAVVLGERPGIVAVAGAVLVLTGLLALAGGSQRPAIPAGTGPAPPDTGAPAMLDVATGKAPR
jgi:DME family drug/metabolite transporter